ncbi:unnamed protein product [Effrenium voratum]|uniref:EF-hand domain-containing protein n=1 Tax=Effrenium voratum TaxID=2562239 RepID=A0AA36JGZ0_9DINO|nr:unnamed protein product [Effrenium voratum]
MALGEAAPEAPKFLVNSAMASLTVMVQPPLPEEVDSAPPLCPETVPVEGKVEKEVMTHTQGEPEMLALTPGGTAANVGLTGATLQKFGANRTRSLKGRKSEGDTEVKDSWAAAEMLQLTGEDKIMGRFDTIIGVMVLLNALAMAINLECLGAKSGTALGIANGDAICVITPALDFSEHFFAAVFTMELLYRLYRIRCDYFRDAWNWLDASLVLVAVVDLYVVDALLADSPANNATTLRVFRVVKLARVLRIARALHLFRGLRVLIKACSSFLPSLSWSMALLGLCILCGGLLIGNLVQDFILDEAQDLETRDWIWRHYGTSFRAIYTMYEITFAGNWGIYARPVLEHVSQGFVLFYVTYITFVVFAVIRVITAIFLRETLEAANNDAELMVQEGLRRKATYIHKLEAIFNAIDESQDGLIDEDELNELFMDSRVTTYLETLEIDVLQSSALFHLLANTDGQITCTDFIDGILRCKGPARAIDQIMMEKNVRRLEDQIKYLIATMETADVIPKRPSRPSQKNQQRRMLDDQITLLATAKMTDIQRASSKPDAQEVPSPEVLPIPDKEPNEGVSELLEASGSVAAGKMQLLLARAAENPEVRPQVLQALARTEQTGRLNRFVENQGPEMLVEWLADLCLAPACLRVLAKVPLHPKKREELGLWAAVTSPQLAKLPEAERCRSLWAKTRSREPPAQLAQPVSVEDPPRPRKRKSEDTVLQLEKLGRTLEETKRVEAYETLFPDPFA